ncbi:LOW QUALITY PROTEIN: hypothetical protein Cgig2_000546 [Carnegiea gigantea]|uniref:Uncharacterized protein n=1 Tax=Carnegiea gigantea TaxID=171969 RepID=A0A9Q1GTG8_9CARY|nr:LOW QUALITY PROTEIN: hypothetical protein Cgig2_000546 [Carnegiea gigantea]
MAQHSTCRSKSTATGEDRPRENKLGFNFMYVVDHRRRPASRHSLPCRCRQHSAKREREREGAVRSPVFVAWESNAVIGGKPKTCWALGLQEPPTSPSPAAGCSLLGFSRASGEFLKSYLRGVCFYSVEVTAGLRFLSPPAPSTPAYQSSATVPETGVSPDFRRRTISEGLFRAQPGGGDGFDGVNSEIA